MSVGARPKFQKKTATGCCGLYTGCHSTAVGGQPTAVDKPTAGGGRSTDGGWKVTDGGWRLLSGAGRLSQITDSGGRLTPTGEWEGVRFLKGGKKRRQGSPPPAPPPPREEVKTAPRCKMTNLPSLRGESLEGVGRHATSVRQGNWFSVTVDPVSKATQ